LVELDPRFTKEDLKEQKREKKDPLNAKLLRPIPNGEFELIPLETTPRRTSRSARIFQNLSKLS